MVGRLYLEYQPHRPIYRALIASSCASRFAYTTGLIGPNTLVRSSKQEQVASTTNTPLNPRDSAGLIFSRCLPTVAVTKKPKISPGRKNALCSASRVAFILTGAKWTPGISRVLGQRENGFHALDSTELIYNRELIKSPLDAMVGPDGS